MAVIYTVGHSNHTTEALIALLQQHAITLVVDVRSQPYSKWADQFNREFLTQDLAEAGIAYRFMGDSLGGRPEHRSLYDTPDAERPNYKRMAKAPAYLAGIETLVSLAETDRLTVLCSEGDHSTCHRHLLITQTLVADGHRVRHIQPDGALVEGTLEPEQLTLFG